MKPASQLAEKGSMPVRALHLVLAVPLALAATAGSADSSANRGRDDRVAAGLSGYNEVHFIPGPPAALRGAISSSARGAFKATIDKDTNVVSYELRYSGLEGDVTQAHIHFGQNHTVGGIVVWLCQTAAAPAPASVAASTPTCPQQGTVTGTIGPAQLLAQDAQGIAADEFGELLRAIRSGATYANVHSSLFPPGEIRGQIRDSHNH
ncbi:MAG: CHRD domain-containing protein [Steroidobacteraceae bacterium]